MGGDDSTNMSSVVEFRSFVAGIWEGMISGLETMNYVALLEIKWIMKSYQQLI